MGRSYIPAEIDRRIREAARNRCGYCLSPQHLVMARLEIEHIIPTSKGGSIDPKTGHTVPLFNPRLQNWAEHFRWSDDGLRVIGLTSTGRATVIALRLSDDPDALTVRSYWIMAGWHPPPD